MKVKQILSTLLILAIFLPTAVFGEAFPDEYTEGDFKYNLFSDSVAVCGYTGTDEIVVIPDELGGYPVKAINSNAFQNCLALKAATIPSTVLSIQQSAFSYCPNLAEITICAENISGPGEGDVFAYCPKLKK